MAVPRKQIYNASLNPRSILVKETNFRICFFFSSVQNRNSLFNYVSRHNIEFYTHLLRKAVRNEALGHEMQ